MVKVLLADDHRIVRDGLRALVERQSDLQVIGEAADGRDAVELARRHSPDVVVMDIGMPELNGIEATRQIRAQAPGARVVALSVYADRRSVMAMLQAGASGYVTKESAAEELLQSIRVAAAKGTYLSPEVASLVVENCVDRQPDAETTAFSILSSREREVLQLIAEGHSTRGIAARLHLSTKTVESHRRNLAGKLGTHSVAELTRYAIREGLTFPLE